MILGKKDAAQVPSWHFTSPPRPGPGQRRVPLPPDVPPEPRASDCVDYCAPPSDTAPSWAPVWRRLHTSGIQRQHRVIIWKLMHGALQSRAYMAYVALRARPRDATPPFCFTHPGCDDIPDTITHQIFHCPVATRSLLWLTAICGKPSHPAQCRQRLRVKPHAHQGLWQRLRVTTLYAIWNASKLARGGQPQTTAGIAAFVMHTLTKAIRQDWCRVQAEQSGGLPALTAGQISTSEWLRGRTVLMDKSQFEDLWCPNNVLCQVTHTHNLRVHWTVAHPVPVPSTA